MIGRTLGHYRVVAKLGEGGMGQVYAADDTKLQRRVALKLLPPEMAADPERLERVQREARSFAALSHPNVVIICSVEEADGIQLLTMELVEGMTLGDLTPAAGLPFDQLLRLAAPLLDAVAAAHEHGIVHRDLKPTNVMLANGGRLKVLDTRTKQTRKLYSTIRDVLGPPRMTRDGQKAARWPLPMGTIRQSTGAPGGACHNDAALRSLSL